jgi:hypothetical protein
MMRNLTFILLMVTSLLLVSCGEEENLIPVNTTINMNGFLDSFKGGRIDVKIYSDINTVCSDFLDTSKNITEVEEKLVTIDIPKDSPNLDLSQENIKIKPGVKTIYAALYDEAGNLSGHDCQKAIKCSSLIETPLPDDAYEIEVGTRACVYIDIKLIP